MIQLNKNEISKNAETETSNNSSLPAANECDSETSFNKNREKSAISNNIYLARRRARYWEKKEKLNARKEAKKNDRKCNYSTIAPSFDCITCEQTIHMRFAYALIVRDSRGKVQYRCKQCVNRWDDHSGIYDFDQMEQPVYHDEEAGDVSINKNTGDNAGICCNCNAEEDASKNSK